MEMVAREGRTPAYEVDSVDVEVGELRRPRPREPRPSVSVFSFF